LTDSIVNIKVGLWLDQAAHAIHGIEGAEMTPALRAAVRAGGSDDDLQAIATREGMTPLVQQALALARTGEISLLEVYRSRLD